MSGGKARIAIYAALDADSTLDSIVSDGIYAGYAPQDVSCPYIVISDMTTDKRFDSKDTLVQSHLVRIYSYSTDDSPEQIESMRNAIYNALHKQILTVSGNTFIDCFQEGLDDTTIMEDGRTWRSILEFLVTIQ